MASEDSRCLRAVDDVTRPIVRVRPAGRRPHSQANDAPSTPATTTAGTVPSLRRATAVPSVAAVPAATVPAAPAASTRSAPLTTTSTGNSDDTVNTSPGATTSRTMLTSRSPAPGVNAPGPEPPTKVIRSADDEAPGVNTAALPVEPAGTYAASPAASTPSSPPVPWTSTPSGPPTTRNIGGEAVNPNGSWAPSRCSPS